jgi:integrase
MLIDLGFVEYLQALKAAGHPRLFMEWKFNAVKGYGKGATKWFSHYLFGLGWARNNTRVFHSFRHTLSSECVNQLGMTPRFTAQISGHERGLTELDRRYLKDLPPELLTALARLDYGLPAIAKFDIPAGMKALQDALDRKRDVKNRTVR